MVSKELCKREVLVLLRKWDVVEVGKRGPEVPEVTDVSIVHVIALAVCVRAFSGPHEDTAKHIAVNMACQSVAVDHGIRQFFAKILADDCKQWHLSR